ncbi:DUF2190 family protein [Candidatus Pacearchaeota archaeon]|nr:DUF2190 family protein [Candidatus Pacearchaeota archaeon]
MSFELFEDRENSMQQQTMDATKLNNIEKELERIWRVIQRANSSVAVPKTVNTPTVPDPTANDHGALGGLEDDDHTHYLLIDGTRAMTGALDMNENYIDKVEAIQFELIPTIAVHQEGLMHWSDDSKTLEVGMAGGEVILQLGQELHVYSTNQTGVTITNGQVVYINGAQGQRPTITLAKSDDPDTSKVIGIATEDIEHNTSGYVTTFGTINDIDTSAWSAGDELWLSATTAGAMTNVEPAKPNCSCSLGIVAYSHATEGKMEFHYLKGTKLEFLRDVEISSITDNDFLRYDSASTLWKNEPTINIEHFMLKNGWDVGFDGSLSFNEGTRTFTLTIVTPHSYYLDGIKYTVSSNKTVVVADATDLYYVYIDSAGDLIASTTSWQFTDLDKAFVAYVYYNSSDAKGRAGYEMHTHKIDRYTHGWEHTFTGTQWLSGLAVTDAGSDLIDVSSGGIVDEDIHISIVDDDTPTDMFEQILSPASISLWYRTGASGDWSWSTASTTPALLVSDVLQRNDWNGSTWSLQDVTLNRYTAVWIIATNDVEHPIIAVVGQGDSATAGDFDNDNLVTDMEFGDMPTLEFSVIARLQLQRKVASPYYELIDIVDYRGTDVNNIVRGAAANSHNALAGLQGGGADEYYHLNLSAYGFLFDADQAVKTTSDVTFNSAIISAGIDVTGITSTSTLDITGVVDTNSSSIAISKQGALSATNIQWIFSHRSNNRDMILYDYDGTTFTQWLKFDEVNNNLYVGKNVDFGAGIDVTDITNLVDSKLTIAGSWGSNGQVLTTNGVDTVSWATPSTGVTDHGALSGLLDDDHPQYYKSGDSPTFGPTVTIGGNIIMDDNVSNMFISGGNATNAGANILLYGGAHSTLPNSIRFRVAGSTYPLEYTHSTTLWEMLGDLEVTGDLTTEGLIVENTLTLGTVDIVDVGGGLRFAGGILPSVDNTHGIGHSSYRFTDVWAVDGSINTSFADMKEQTNSIVGALAIIDQLRPVEYYWKDVTERVNNPLFAKNLGFILEEVDLIDKRLVHEHYLKDENNEYILDEYNEKIIVSGGLEPMQFVAMNTQGIKELMVENNTLKTQVSQLTNIVTAMEIRLSNLENA